MSNSSDRRKSYLRYRDSEENILDLDSISRHNVEGYYEKLVDKDTPTVFVPPLVIKHAAVNPNTQIPIIDGNKLKKQKSFLGLKIQKPSMKDLEAKMPKLSNFARSVFSNRRSFHVNSKTPSKFYQEVKTSLPAVFSTPKLGRVGVYAKNVHENLKRSKSGEKLKLKNDQPSLSVKTPDVERKNFVECQKNNSTNTQSPKIDTQIGADFLHISKSQLVSQLTDEELLLEVQKRYPSLRISKPEVQDDEEESEKEYQEVYF